MNSYFLLNAAWVLKFARNLNDIQDQLSRLFVVGQGWIEQLTF